MNAMETLEMIEKAKSKMWRKAEDAFLKRDAKNHMFFGNEWERLARYANMLRARILRERRLAKWNELQAKK